MTLKSLRSFKNKKQISIAKQLDNCAQYIKSIIDQRPQTASKVPLMQLKAEEMQRDQEDLEKLLVLLTA